MEDRIIECRIAGKAYPLALTVRATKAITERFGDVGALGEQLKESSLAEGLELVLWLLDLLMREGAALRALLHPEEEQAKLPGTEALEVLLSPGELLGLKGDLFQVMAVGMGREVASEPGKNPEAGQATEGSLPG